jgi:hypothetical protein
VDCLPSGHAPTVIHRGTCRGGRRFLTPNTCSC